MVGQPISVSSAALAVLLLQVLCADALAQSPQKAKIEELLANGDAETALVQARVYYNTATLKETRYAIRLLAAALDQARGKTDPGIGARFLEEQSVGARTPTGKTAQPPILRSIPIDASPYAAQIENSRGANTYRALMDRGELLLLAGQADDARTAFLAACQLAKPNNKELFNAVEGVARAIRAEDGVTGRANALVMTLMLGEQLPAEMQGWLDEQFARGDLQVAGQRVILPMLSRYKLSEAKGEASHAADAEVSGATGTGDFETFDLGDPAVVAAASSMLGDALTRCLAAWQGSGASGGISDDRATELGRAITSTDMGCLSLFHLAHAFQFRAGDEARVVTAELYEAAAVRAVAELCRLGRSPRSTAIVRSLKDHMGGYKAALWPLINQGDSTARACLSQIYSTYLEWVPPEDSALNRPIKHIRIGLAECTFLAGDFPRAEQMLSDIERLPMDRGEALALHWASATMYQYSGRIDQAIPHLQFCAADRSYNRSREALHFLFIAQMKTGRNIDAGLTAREYRSRFGQDKVAAYMDRRLSHADPDRD